MKPYKLGILNPAGKHEEIKAVAVIVFEEMPNNTVALRMFDNPGLSEAWWRLVITRMYTDLDSAMTSRRKRTQGESDRK